jgi:hypothetical protein
LSESNLSELEKKYLHGINYRKGSYHRDRTKKILRIIIDETIDSAFLEKLLQGVEGDFEMDFFVSVSSSEQTAIVDVPEQVLALHKKIGGRMCFSYTCTF